MIHTVGNVECFELREIFFKSALPLWLAVLDRRGRFQYLWHVFGSHRILTKIELAKIRRTENP